MKFQMLGAMLFAAILTVPAVADDADAGKKKGKKGPQQSSAAQIEKQLESVELTDEQSASIKELGKTADAEMKTIRDEGGLTPEVMKKRMEAMKTLKDSGKKGKEMAEAINEEAGLTADQVAAFEKMNAARMKFQKSVIGLLTDAQKENLPQQLQRSMAAEKQGKGKKKKNAS